MKKQNLSLLICLIVICTCLLPAAGLQTCGTISVRLNSNIAGLTKRDVQQLFELHSDNVEYGLRGGDPVSVADYGGTEESGRLVAGRTYSVYYVLSAADGWVLPDQLTENSLDISCGKGVKVISKAIVTSPVRMEDGSFDVKRGVQIFAQVVVDGNVFQRVIGFLHDLILKVKAWSLY